HYRFTFTLLNEPLDLILNIMSHSAPLNYKLISNDYYVLEELK
ncbi:FecR domain-containing protein, partial [Bacteroides fragilis]